MTTAIIPVDRAGEFGINSDIKPHELPLNVWSAGQNVRMRDAYVEKFFGQSLVFDPPSVAPMFALAVPRNTVYYWIYAGLSKVYFYDGVHTDITRQTAGVDVDYNADAETNWTGCLIGGVPVLNNGVDVPQALLPVASGTKLLALTAWPATYVCGAMRTYKQFLVALNVTKNGTNYPHMVKWSHQADPGALPVTWDETDVTKDAGEVELKESGGALVDSCALRDLNMIYKEDEIWSQQFIGGNFIFRFAKVFGSIGALSRRCVLEIFKGVHVVFGFDDIIQHDGQNAQSILDSRLRRTLYNQIASGSFRRSFVVNNAAMREVWFCFSTISGNYPDRAIVWNYSRNTLGVRDLNAIAHIEAGQINPGAANDTWAAGGTWLTDFLTWGENTFTPSKNRLLMCGIGNAKLYLGDDTNQLNGASFTSYVERTGLGFPLRKDGPPDFTTMKQILRVFPRIEGTAGGQINVYVGAQDKAGGAVTWEAPEIYTIGTSISVDSGVTARLHALKFESTSDVDWRLHGYDVEIADRGRYG